MIQQGRLYRLIGVDQGTGGARRPPAVVAIPAAVVGVAMALPVLYLTIRAFAGGAEPIGEILRPRTLETLAATLALAVAVTATAVAVALPLAWLTVRTDLPLRGALSVLAVLPLAIPSYVAAFAILTFLGPRGLLQGALAGPLGVARLPDVTGFPGALIALTLVTYPYVYLSVASALGRMDPRLEEASRALGAGPWRTFWRITIPLLRPAMAAGALLVGLYTLSDFGAVSLMRYGSFTRVIYSYYQASIDRSAAATLGLLLVALTAGVLALELLTRGRARQHSSGAGAARRMQLTRLGQWRTPALVFGWGMTFSCLGIPLGAVGYWSLRGAGAEEALAGVWTAAGRSALASGLAAWAAVAMAIPIAYLAARYRGWMVKMLEGLTYSSYALPGIVLALSLVFFAANYVPALYQSLALLVFAYVVRFLPQAIGPARSTLLQVKPRLEESARSVGRGPLQALTSVTLPLMRPGLMAGGALVFLTAMKELPATLLLGPTGYETLATRVWMAADEGFFAQAGSPALLLIVVASVPMLFLIPRGVGRP